MAQKHNSYEEKPMTRYGTVQGPSRRYRRLRHPSFPAAEWTVKNPLLQRGEIGFEIDTHKAKVGDGTTYWNDLPYSFVAETEWGNIVGDIADQTDLKNALDAKQDVLTAGTNINITGNTISATDTTYTGSDGITLTGTNFTNSGVRSVATGASNGTISVNTNGTSAEVAVYGLGSAAYTASSDYATSAQGGKADTAVQPGDLATVATTGDYDDLLNKPTIPAAQVNSDWNANSGVAEILNKPTLGTMAAESASDYTPTASLAAVALSGAYSDLSGTPSLATVATSGSYNDLLNKPTIPTVNNPTITITQGGVTKGSFTLNQASGDTIALDAGSGAIAWGNITGTLANQTDLQSALNAKQDTLTAGTNISITGTTISATDTTYTGSNGITLTGTNFTNSGVRAVASGTANGTISVNTNGTSADVAVTGLGSAAYTSSSDYATSAQGGKADTAVQPGDNVSDLNNDAGYQTAGDVATAISGKQDTLTAGTNISITGTTISATNTTYTGSNGITLTGTNFTNSGVRSVATGTTSGTISVNTNGTSADVAVNGWSNKADVATTLAGYGITDGVKKGHELIAYQIPTSGNNYTWYRKYRDGWVEQGGVLSGSKSIAAGAEGNLGIITLPVAMADINYTATAIGNGYTVLINFDPTATTVLFRFGAYASSTRTLTQVRWYVCGRAAS